MSTEAIRKGLKINRRCLPDRTPRAVQAALIVVLLGTVGWNLVRDVAYLRTVPIDDIFAYECYARAFWHGPAAMTDAPHTRQCAAHAFQFWTAPPRAFHTLPREYPAPALAVYTMPLLVPFAPYDVTFMVMMGLLTFGVTAWLAVRRLFLSAVAFALYVLVGGWATALARYDLIPSVLTVVALVLAERRRWNWAYALLAAGTLLKVYPALLVPVLAVQQWRITGEPPWRQIGLYIVVTVGGLLPGALLDPHNFIQPLIVNSVRPPQIESIAGSLLWLSGRLGNTVAGPPDIPLAQRDRRSGWTCCLGSNYPAPGRTRGGVQQSMARSGQPGAIIRACPAGDADGQQVT